MSNRQVPCPTCRQPADLKDNPFRPFCSERCRLIDLGEWFGEGHVIPGQAGEAPPASEEPDDPEERP